MLNIQEISFAYHPQRPLFSGLSLALPAGGICGLLGKNGSGKTSLLKMMAGLMFPASGDLNILSHQPSNRAPHFLEQVFFLPEDVVLPDMNAVQYEHCYARFYSAFNSEEFHKNLREFGLPKDQRLSQLSHGQKKKFLIIFGLATQAKLMLLDEPTNGLDIPSKAQFRQLLLAHATPDRLMIISTHQVHDVENIIDSVVVLNQGQIIFNQTLARVSEKLSFVVSDARPENALYSEKKMGGYFAVLPNTDGAETEVDLEGLFNTVLGDPQAIQTLFGGAA